VVMYELFALVERRMTRWGYRGSEAGVLGFLSGRPKNDQPQRAPAQEAAAR